MSDVLVRAIDRAAGVRVVAAVTTQLARVAAERHHAVGVGACALGRGLTAGLLLATLTKGGERVTVQIHADGPLGGVVVDATDAGDVRGYVVHPEDAIAPCAGRCVVATALGRDGVVNVLRDLGLKERYAGQVRLVTGEIDEDVESYLTVSEQIPSALGCEVVLDVLDVRCAAGLLVQAMPDGDASRVRQAQHALRTGALYAAIESGTLDARGIASALYGADLEFLDERPVRFECRCAPSKVIDALTTLTTVELDEMIAEKSVAEVTCNFCNTKYSFTPAELEAIRQSVAHGPRERN